MSNVLRVCCDLAKWNSQMCKRMRWKFGSVLAFMCDAMWWHTMSPPCAVACRPFLFLFLFALFTYLFIFAVSWNTKFEMPAFRPSHTNTHTHTLCRHIRTGDDGDEKRWQQVYSAKRTNLRISSFRIRDEDILKLLSAKMCARKFMESVARAHIYLTYSILEYISFSTRSRTRSFIDVIQKIFFYFNRTMSRYNVSDKMDEKSPSQMWNWNVYDAFVRFFKAHTTSSVLRCWWNMNFWMHWWHTDLLHLELHLLANWKICAKFSAFWSALMSSACSGVGAREGRGGREWLKLSLSSLTKDKTYLFNLFVIMNQQQQQFT